MTVTAYHAKISEKSIDVVEAGRKPRKGRVAFNLDRNLEFSIEALRSYAFARWEAVIYDAMVVSASIEFADLSVKRPSRGWARRITLRIPVHDPVRWNDSAVSNSLHDALGFLTGDFWTLEFVKRLKAVEAPIQECLPFPRPTEAVIAYSDGMDSRAVAGLAGKTLGDKLVRVRVGSKAADKAVIDGQLLPFARVPYRFKKIKMSNRESSARTRGFKFAMISGLAAHLADAPQILVPESGQGSIGPALITVSHAYPDYRNHPLFTKRMARFLTVLLKNPVEFVFPRLWQTKGETLREFAALPESDSWKTTRSCWRDVRWSALDHKHLQCGICAACMLRRMSVHAAGLREEDGIYICTDLSAPSLDAAIHPDFTRNSRAFEQYAIAGTLHLDHMADMASADARPAVQRHAILTGMALGISTAAAEEKIVSMLERHAAEWSNFLGELGENSFIRKWTRASQ
jgi:hypothetical protein